MMDSFQYQNPSYRNNTRRQNLPNPITRRYTTPVPPQSPTLPYDPSLDAINQTPRFSPAPRLPRRTTYAARPPPQKPEKPQFLQQVTVNPNPRPTVNTQPVLQNGGTGFTKDDTIIAVTGVKGVGRSTFISLLMGDGIEVPQSYANPSGVYQFMHNGKQVFLIDTPGFDEKERSEADIVKDIAAWVSAVYAIQAKLAGIIYLHRIPDTRAEKATIRNVGILQRLCGPNSPDAVLLVATHWSNVEGSATPENRSLDRLAEQVGTDVYADGRIQKRSNVIKHDNSKVSALNIINLIVSKRHKVVLDVQRQLVDERKEQDNTQVVQQLQAKLAEQRQLFQRELDNLKNDIKFTMLENDRKWLKQLEDDRKLYDARIQKVYDDTEALKVEFQKTLGEKDMQYHALQEQITKQQEIYDQQLRDAAENLAHFEAETAKKHADSEQQREGDSQRAGERETALRKMIEEEAARVQVECEEVAKAQIAAQIEAIDLVHQREISDIEKRAEDQKQQFELQQEQEQIRYCKIQEDHAKLEHTIQELQREIQREVGDIDKQIKDQRQQLEQQQEQNQVRHSKIQEEQAQLEGKVQETRQEIQTVVADIEKRVEDQKQQFKLQQEQNLIQHQKALEDHAKLEQSIREQQTKLEQMLQEEKATFEENLQEHMKLAQTIIEEHTKLEQNVQEERAKLEQSIQETQQEIQRDVVNFEKRSEDEKQKFRLQHEQDETRYREAQEKQAGFEQKIEEILREVADIEKRASDQNQQFTDIEERAKDQKQYFVDMEKQAEDYKRQFEDIEKRAEDYKRQFEDMEKRAEDQKRQFELQQEQDKARYREFQESQVKLEERVQEVLRESQKRSTLNPKRWIKGKFQK